MSQKNTYFHYILFLTFNVSNSNFLNGGGSDVEVIIFSLITVISCSVVQERSTLCSGKKRRFLCSNDLIKRIDKVIEDSDVVVILHFDRKNSCNIDMVFFLQIPGQSTD